MRRISLYLTLLTVIVFVMPSTSVGLVDSMTLVAKGNARYMGFIKVYDAHLYVPQKLDHERILSTEVSKCLKLDYDVGLKPEDLIKGATVVLERQHPQEHLERIQPYVDQLHNAYRPVDKGDSYTLCYDAEKELTTLSLNAEPLVAIQSEEFSSAYFGIWLSPDQPLSRSLQKQLAAPAGN